MNIGILGGSFDPPHKGHVTIANRLLKLKHFDQIWLMPCYQHPFNKKLSSPKKRLEMTKFLENTNTKVSDFEIANKSTSYTIETLRSLAKKFPQDKFCWIIGTDQVKDFTKWKEWKKIVDNFKLIVVPRTNFRMAKEELKDISKLVISPNHINLIGRERFPPIYISSTLARKKIAEKKSISNMIPKKIKNYIIQSNLYK